MCTELNVTITVFLAVFVLPNACGARKAKDRVDSDIPRKREEVRSHGRFRGPASHFKTNGRQYRRAERCV